MYTGSDDEINSTRNNRGEHALRYHPVFQKHSAWRNNSQARRAARQHVAAIIEKDALCGVAEGCEDDLSFELNNTSNPRVSASASIHPEKHIDRDPKLDALHTNARFRRTNHQLGRRTGLPGGPNISTGVRNVVKLICGRNFDTHSAGDVGGGIQHARNSIYSLALLLPFHFPWLFVVSHMQDKFRSDTEKWQHA